MDFSCSIETSSNKGCGSPHLSSSFSFPQKKKKKDYPESWIWDELSREASESEQCCRWTVLGTIRFLPRFIAPSGLSHLFPSGQECWRLTTHSCALL